MLLLSPWLPKAYWLLLIALFVYFESCLPLYRKAMAYGPDVSAASAVLLFVRALALEAGLVAGAAHMIVGRHRGQVAARARAGIEAS